MQLGALASDAAASTLSAAVAPDGQSWYDVVTTVATLTAALGAIGAIIVGILTVRQRTAADARSQWWSRVQWAIELSFHADAARRTVGFDALALLARSPLAGPGDAAFLEGLALDALEAVRARGEGAAYEIVDHVPEPPTGGIASQARPASARIPVSRDEVAAARLRVATDALQGTVTEPWIELLAGTPNA